MTIDKLCRQTIRVFVIELATVVELISAALSLYHFPLSYVASIVNPAFFTGTTS
jgi:hypothetical protein